MKQEEKKIVDKWLEGTILTLEGKRVDSVDSYDELLAAIRERGKRLRQAAQVWQEHLDDGMKIAGFEPFRVQQAAARLLGGDTVSMEQWPQEDFDKYLKLLEVLCRALTAGAEEPG